MARTLRFGSRVSTADLDNRIARHVSPRRSPTSFEAARAAEDFARQVAFEVSPKLALQRYVSYVPRNVTFGKRDRTPQELAIDAQIDEAARRR